MYSQCVCVCVCGTCAHPPTHTKRAAASASEESEWGSERETEKGERVLVSECLGNFLMLQKVNGKLEKNIDIYR